MTSIKCPKCGEMIEIPQGGSFDKTLHDPPKLTKVAHEIERERFKTALGDLPLGSATTEDEMEKQKKNNQHREQLKKDQEEAQTDD